MSELQPINGDSPFEAGRIPCSQGGEDRWSTRWLMEQMTYPTWQHFEPVIERAKATAKNEGFNVKTLFTVNRENSGGRPRVDYFVTRYAAYLIAMNGDPRKPAVAAAQHYFAVRTRQAETAAALPDISTPEGIAYMAAMFNDTAQKLVLVTNEKKMLAAAIERDAPLVAKAEAHTASDRAVHRQEFAREVQAWGQKIHGIHIKHQQVYDFLGFKGMTVRGNRTDAGHATAHAVTSGWAWTDKGTTEDGYPYATTRLYPRGQDVAWKWITSFVKENGSLALPREIGRAS